jgi:hypothetical protein
MGSMDWEHNLQRVDQQFLCKELPWSCRKNNFVLAGGVSQFVTYVTQPHPLFGPPGILNKPENKLDMIVYRISSSFQVHARRF